MSDAKIGYRDVLKQKEYLKIIFSTLISRFGDAIDAVATTWIVYEITGSAAWSATIFGVNRVPTVIVTPLAGAWVEGKNKKCIMIITDLIRACCVACIATCYLMGSLRPWILLFATFAISIAEAFREPAGIAFTPKVLGKEYYSYGLSLLTFLAALVELIGTATAAGIITIIGVSGAIYIDMITFLLSAGIILLLKTKEQNLSTYKHKCDFKEYINNFLSGVKYVANQKLIRFFLGYIIFANAFMVPLISLQAPLASEILHGGAEVLSIVGIAGTIGMLVGSAIYPKIENRIRGKALLLISQIYVGVYYAGLVGCWALYDNKLFMYVFVAATTVVVGAAVSVGNAYMHVQSMKKIDENYLARFSSLSTSLGCVTLPIVSFMISVAVRYVGTVSIFVIAALGNTIICVFMAGSHALDEV